MSTDTVHGTAVDPADRSLVGTLALLRRYPVKSMLGEDLPAGEVTGYGLDGDRSHAVIDRVTGKVASAKDPRRWQLLLRFSARGARPAPDGPPSVSITFPDGSTAESDDPAVDARLSAVLGRPVELRAERPAVSELDRLSPDDALAAGPEVEAPLAVLQMGAAAPAGGFFDYAPLHLLTTSTANRISELSQSGHVDAIRYRPNLVIQTPTPSDGFVENAWVGHTLFIGDSVELQLLIPTPRCSIPMLAHGELQRDPDAVRVLVGHNRRPLRGFGTPACAGLYAEVRRAGQLRVGDPVWITAAQTLAEDDIILPEVRDG
jgi:uncharacterized protein YcbX